MRYDLSNRCFLLNQLFIPMLAVVSVYCGIHILCLVIIGGVFGHWGYFLDPFIFLSTSLPFGIVAALFWLRGIKAKKTTIRHGGFVGFYAFVVSVVNPAAIFLIMSSFGMSLALNWILVPFFGFWFGRLIEKTFPVIAFKKVTILIK